MHYILVQADDLANGPVVGPTVLLSDQLRYEGSFANWFVRARHSTAPLHLPPRTMHPVLLSD